MIEKNINLYNILENLNNMEILTKIWLFAWIIIFAASLKKWEWSEDLWPFGIIIIYIMVIPLYKRWDKYLNGMLLKEFSQSWVYVFILSLLIIIWLILFLKLLPTILDYLKQNEFINHKILENKPIKLFLSSCLSINLKITWWFRNLSIIFSSWIFIPALVQQEKKLVDYTATFFCKTLDTEVEQKIFFFSFIFLPRIIGLIAIFYDFLVEGQIYWFPKVSFLIIISLVTSMSFFFLEKVVIGYMENLDQFIYLDGIPEIVDPEEVEFLVERNVIRRPQYQRYRETLLLRSHLEGYVEQETYDRWCNMFVFYDRTRTWWATVREDIVENFYPKVLFALVTVEILLQIILIIK